jgi:hypothetical protein
MHTLLLSISKLDSAAFVCYLHGSGHSTPCRIHRRDVGFVSRQPHGSIGIIRELPLLLRRDDEEDRTSAVLSRLRPLRFGATLDDLEQPLV